MQWYIEGAEARTGKDVAITVEAETSAQVEEYAQAEGILISRLERVDTSSGIGTVSPRGTAGYPALKSSSDTLRTLGGIVGGVGVMMIVGGAVGLGIAFVGSIGSEMLSLFIVLAGLGIQVSLIGLMLSFLGCAGEALRDIAINSFRQSSK